MALTNIQDRIEDLISDLYSTDIDADLDAAYTSAVATVADTVPPAILLKELGEAESTSFDDEVLPDLSGKKTLLVTRLDADGIERKCHPADPTDYAVAKEANSIYEATEWNPVYTIKPGGVLAIAPEDKSSGQTDLGTVYNFTYPLTIPATTVIAGFPNELIQAVVLKSAINLLQTYIGNASQEEEDTEIMQLVQNQTGQYQAEFDREMQRYTQGAAE